MLILNFWGIRFDKLKFLLVKIFIYANCFAALFFLSQCFIRQDSFPKYTHKKSKDYSIIGNGFFNPIPIIVSKTIPSLTRDLVLLSFDKERFLIGLKTSLDSKLVADKEDFYLSYEKGILCFSDKPTDLKIKLYHEDSVRVKFEAFKNSIPVETLEWSPIIPVMVEEKNPEKEFYKELLSAQALRPDLLLENYGGAEYKKLRDNFRLKIADKDIIFCSTGDYFSLEKGFWVKTDSCKKVSWPLMFVEQISEEFVRVKIFNQFGFSCSRIGIPVLKVSNQKQEAISAVRPRTINQVTGILGSGRRVILKKGDWWVQEGGHWRSLKTEKDIDECINCRISGNLFILDSIEKDSDQILVRGKMFDAMHVVMNPFNMPIKEEKKANKKNVKKINLAHK